jgi:GNAT superfamily N-acetyltransferase
MGFLKTQNVDNQEDTLELERIYLRANATGQGIGEQAILFVEKLAKASGKKRLLVKAMDSAADAMRFYQKMGFKEVTRFQLAFPMMKEMYKGMIIMEKCL